MRTQMQILIELSERDYRMACEYPDALIGVYAHAIKNGTPLTKGHEKLKNSVKETSTMNKKYESTDRVVVVALQDHEDGNAYEYQHLYAYYLSAFREALLCLNEYADHVLIVSEEDYAAHPHDYHSLAPYAIHISKGIYA